MLEKNWKRKISNRKTHFKRRRKEGERRARVFAPNSHSTEDWGALRKTNRKAVKQRQDCGGDATVTNLLHQMLNS